MWQNSRCVIETNILSDVKAWVSALALLNMHNWNNSKAVQHEDFNLGTQTQSVILNILGR